MTVFPCARDRTGTNFVRELLVAAVVALIFGGYFAFGIARLFAPHTARCMTEHLYNADVACLHGIDPTAGH